MSSPAVIAVAVAALVLGVPVISAGAHLEARHRAAGAADAAALAAADAAAGLIAEEPCGVAHRVAAASGVTVTSCEIDATRGEARVMVRAGTLIGVAEARARAAPESPPALVLGVVGENGWAWPSGSRSTTQGFHDGFAIDLAVGADGLLYAPYDGVVVQAGGDGAGRPAVCIATPNWWRGENHSVVMRHEYQGRTLYSSHNHIAPGSTRALGVVPGDRVAAGQAVARAGMSGCTSGPHTHFTLATRLTNAQPDLDPFEFLGVP